MRFFPRLRAEKRRARRLRAAVWAKTSARTAALIMPIGLVVASAISGCSLLAKTDDLDTQARAPDGGTALFVSGGWSTFPTPVASAPPRVVLGGFTWSQVTRCAGPVCVSGGFGSVGNSRQVLCG